MITCVGFDNAVRLTHRLFLLLGLTDRLYHSTYRG
jgi:hypothetical protein